MILYLGIVITVHNQTEMPFPEDEGISVSPGTKANVAIKRVCDELYIKAKR